MKIEYLKVKNFLCVGEEPVEIQFNNYGNIVVIKGENLDVDDELDDVDEVEHFSNGSGKSTISESLSYVLYGKLIRKKVTHTEAINNINKKKLEVEVIFSLDNKKYRIVRQRSPNKLQIWEDGPPWNDSNEITLSGIPTTQKFIDDLIGLNHKAFINVVCFGQHNDYNFLDCTPEDQRNIVESLLSLDVFSGLLDVAKEELKDTKQSLKVELRDYERLKDNEYNCTQRIAQITTQQDEWVYKTKETIQRLKEGYEVVKRQLNNTSSGSDLFQYEQATTQIVELKEQIPKVQERKVQLREAITLGTAQYNKLREKRFDISLEVKQLEQEKKEYNKQIEKLRRDISELNSLQDGSKCPSCYGVIDKHNCKHVVTLYENKTDGFKARAEAVGISLDKKNHDLNQLDTKLQEIKSLVESAEMKFNKINDDINLMESKVHELNQVKKPNSDSNELLLAQKIQQIQEQLQSKISEFEGGGPYKNILTTAQADLTSVKEQATKVRTKITEIEGLMPYYEYLIKAFGPDGIRSFAIGEIISTLNDRIKYWLQYLINGRLTLTFDNKLNAVIERNPPNGDPFVYNATCGGERKRIDLAISQAFAYVMMHSSSTWPSLVFLDEVATNIDRKGLKGIYNMICELATEKQVFIITHDTNLLEMLESADTITMRKENGFSRKV